ncbi:methyltransferase domain-containing protein [Nostoc sp. NIES-2111]
MTYDEKAAERLERIYQGSDVVAQRANTMKLLDLGTGENVLDIGSGPGFLAAEMGARVGPRGHVRGIDISEVMVERASRRNALAWVDFGIGDATNLPEPDSAYDVVVSTQVAEYVPDIGRFCREACRVLRPGGRAVFLATDWDAIAWHSGDPARMRAVLDAFGPHCADTRLPRTFARHLREAGLKVVDVSVFPILNTTWDDEAYSCQAISFIDAYVRPRKTIPAEILDAWAAEQRALGASGDYYFLSNRIFFTARRLA